MPISPPPRGIESADPFTPGVVQATSYDVGRVAKVPTIRVRSIGNAFARDDIADNNCELADRGELRPSDNIYPYVSLR
jgi:hypothetical protein